MSNEEFNNSHKDSDLVRVPTNGFCEGEGGVGLNDWSPGGCSRSASRHSDDLIKVVKSE